MGEYKLMKSQYTAPKLSVHGTVVSMTQVFGNDPTQDTFIFNGVPQDVDGSGSLTVP